MTLLCSTRNFSCKLIYNPKLPNKSINLMTTRNSIELINFNAIWIYFVLQKKLNFAPKSHGKCEYLESWRVKQNSRKLKNFFRNAIINYIACVTERIPVLCFYRFFLQDEWTWKLSCGCRCCWKLNFYELSMLTYCQCLYIYLWAFRMRVSSCE